MNSKLPFSEIAEVVMGQSPTKENVNSESNGFPLLNGPTEFTARYPNPVQFTTAGKKFSQPDDILFCVRGSTTGRMNYSDQKYAIGRGIAAIRGKNGYPTPYVRAVIEQNLERLLAAATGSTFPNVGRDLLLNFEVEVTSPERATLANELIVSLEDKIESNRQTNQTLEQIAQAIFKSWFVDFEPVKAKIEALAAGGSADDTELAAMSVISAKNLDELNSLKARNPEAFYKLAQTATLFPAAMQDSELGEIPEGWEVKQLSDICQVINGRAYKNTEFKTEGTPIVRIQNLSNEGKTVYSDLDLPPEKYIDREDFIYAWSATFGPHIWRGPKSIYHYHIWKMEVDESVISRYFLYLSMFRKTEAMKNAGTGSIFTHLTKKIMEYQHVLIGDQAINKKFSDIIVPIFDQISSLKSESTHLADIRDVLLPKLLTGDGLTSEVECV